MPGSSCYALPRLHLRPYTLYYFGGVSCWRPFCQAGNIMQFFSLDQLHLSSGFDSDLLSVSPPYAWIGIRRIPPAYPAKFYWVRNGGPDVNHLVNPHTNGDNNARNCGFYNRQNGVAQPWKGHCYMNAPKFVCEVDY